MVQVFYLFSVLIVLFFGYGCLLVLWFSGFVVLLLGGLVIWLFAVLFHFLGDSVPCRIISATTLLPL